MCYTPVNVETKIDEFNQIMPMAIIWNTKKKYSIERIIHICQPEDLMIRYTILISGKQRQLFYDGKEWRISKPL